MKKNIIMKEKIIAAAERRVRRKGFQALSFRDVAGDVGIKSSSVHYHFPTKKDLGEALIDTYTLKFKGQLDSIAMDDIHSALKSFVSLYENALVVDESVCLCAVLGAESMGLSFDMRSKTRAFFEMNVQWLNTLLDYHHVNEDKSMALLIVTALEGGMVVASASHDKTILTKVAQKLQEIVPDSKLVSSA